MSDAIRSGGQIIAGELADNRNQVSAAAGVATFIVGIEGMLHLTDAGERFQQHSDLSDQISQLQADQTYLRSVEQMSELKGQPAVTSSLDGVITTKQSQVASLQAERQELGSPVIDNIEILAVPLVLGAAAAMFTKRKLRRQQ